MSYESINELLDFSEPTEKEDVAELREFGKLAGWDDPAEDLYEDFRTAPC
jgi:hypothetical protein